MAVGMCGVRRVWGVGGMCGMHGGGCMAGGPCGRGACMMGAIMAGGPPL